MGKWSFSDLKFPGGEFRLVITKLTRGGKATDVTMVRGAPTQISDYSSSDPFGDSTAVLTFPSLTPFDDFDAPDLVTWLGPYSNVDIYWVPSVPLTDDYPMGVVPRIDPFTGQADVIAPDHLYVAGVKGALNRKTVWEGFIASIDLADDGGGQLQVQCQGANFQLDRYLQKPFYPARPWPLEKLIADAFDRTHKPQLRTQNLKTVFPTGWSNVAPSYTGRSANVYAPVVKPGSKWTGYTSRNTGAWEHTLTGFVQDALTNLITDKDSGVTPGNQWTIQHLRAGVGNLRGRQPVLMVRDRFRAADFTVQLGAPGVKCRLSSDTTQSENVIYGDGTDLNGQVWRNAVISDDGSRTDYLPLAASRDVYPPSAKASTASRGTFVSEAFTKFGTGFSQEQATTVAKSQLARDQDPGWSGTIILTSDPSEAMPRWLIHAGMTAKLLSFRGTGADGMNFHVSAVKANPMEGSVELTVDTRYRDLLTVAEAMQRTRDPLTPVRMLQVNKTSVMIEDVQAPWDYSAGSGFIPRASTQFYKQKPTVQTFPYRDWARRHPPLHFPHWYVHVNANASKRASRWTRVPVLTAEKGSIARTEFWCVDAYGRPAKVPFHVSFYKTYVTPSDMPRDGSGPSPYIDGAFESVNPATGQIWDAGNFLAPNTQFITGWGNRADGVYNRAGFSPGSEAEGGSPTGLLFDDATWTFDNTENPDYAKYAAPGTRQKASAITIYAMIYCEHGTDVYFGGRLYRQNPGIS
jgi:hypothetical protein